MQVDGAGTVGGGGRPGRDAGHAAHSSKKNNNKRQDGTGRMDRQAVSECYI